MLGKKGIAALLLMSFCCSMAYARQLISSSVTIFVTHELDIARPSEMITIPWQPLIQQLPGASPQKLVVKDAAGHILPYQVTNLDYDAKGIHAGYADVLFQYDFAAGEKSASFTIEKTPHIVPPFPSKTYARFVPERLDDFAWENDRIAHRTYGPALAAPDHLGTGKEILRASGIDVWSKRVSYPVIDRWYGKANYHRDDGEGLDMVKTGTTRGVGGTGIWDGQKLHTSDNYRMWKLIANGPIRSVFELRYDAWDVNGLKVSELKRFTVDAGNNLNKIESSFNFQANSPTTEIKIGIGISRSTTEKTQFVNAPKVFYQASQHALAQWELSQTQGALGAAVILPEGHSGFAEDAGNHLILTSVVSGQKIAYYFGAGWSLSGHFASKEDWLAYVAATAMRIKSPLQIRLLRN
jgi:hypothetical protein